MKIISVLAICVFYCCVYLLYSGVLNYSLYVDFILALSIGCSLYVYVINEPVNKTKLVSLLGGTVTMIVLFCFDKYGVVNLGIYPLLIGGDEDLFLLFTLGLFLLASHFYVFFNFYRVKNVV